MNLRKTRELLKVLEQRLASTVEYDTGNLSRSIELKLHVGEMGDFQISMNIAQYWKWICHWHKSNNTPVPTEAIIELDASLLEDYSDRGGKNYLPLAANISDVLEAINDDFSDYVSEGLMNSFGKW